MGSLLRKYWSLTLISLLFFASASLAQTVNMTLTGVGDQANAGGVYVDPYVATVGNQTGVSVICDDWTDETSIGESWIANVNTIASVDAHTNTTAPLFGNSSVPNVYNEAAYLGAQLLANPTNSNVQIAISYALWELTCSTGIKSCAGAPFTTLGSTLVGNSTTVGTAAWYYSQAQGEGSYNPSGWEILTPTSGGPPQEFLVYTPESSSGVLLSADLFGLLGLVFLFRRRLFRSIQ